MFTRACTSVLPLLLAFGAVASVPAVAAAQDRSIPYASGFVGGGVIPEFAVKVTDPAIAAAVQVQGRKLINSSTWGGSIGLWRTRDGRRLVWGLRGEASHQNADASQQTLAASGTLFGQPYAGPLPVPSAKGSATIATGAFLLGWRVGSVMPYAGVGGGVQHVTATFTGLGKGTDNGGVVQVSGGMVVGVNRRVSAFVEYRHQHMSQQITVATQNATYSIRPNHVVAGVTLGLFR
jgi:hypothetical protein